MKASFPFILSASLSSLLSSPTYVHTNAHHLNITTPKFLNKVCRERKIVLSFFSVPSIQKERLPGNLVRRFLVQPTLPITSAAVNSQARMVWFLLLMSKGGLHAHWPQGLGLFGSWEKNEGCDGGAKPRNCESRRGEEAGKRENGSKKKCNAFVLLVPQNSLR